MARTAIYHVAALLDASIVSGFKTFSLGSTSRFRYYTRVLYSALRSLTLDLAERPVQQAAACGQDDIRKRTRQR
jgi:hypothetical protein